MFGKHRSNLFAQCAHLIIRISLRQCIKDTLDTCQCPSAIIQCHNRIFKSRSFPALHNCFYFGILFFYAFQKRRFIVFYLDFIKIRSTILCPELRKERVRFGFLFTCTHDTTSRKRKY